MEKKHKTFRNKLKDYFLPLSIRNQIGVSQSILSYLAKFRYGANFQWLNNKIGEFVDSNVLDVGCGAGYLLNYLAHSGFTKLDGIEPFIHKNINLGAVSVFKSEIFEITKKYKLIMFHHSFEHMSNPQDVFNKLYEILDDNGLVLIRIPIVDSYAFRKYNVSWYGLDAPRHFFLYSVKSLSLLCEQHGFYIEDIVYDSNWQQFYFSESYQLNISLNENFTMFNNKNISFFEKEAAKLNKLKDGDQACFYIRKKSDLNK